MEWKFSVEVYVDADYASSVVDRRSISGYCTLLDVSLIFCGGILRNRKLGLGLARRLSFCSVAHGIDEII